MDSDLPTITEEDGDSSIRSGSTTKSGDKDTTATDTSGGFDEFLGVLKGSSNSKDDTTPQSSASTTDNEVNSNDSSKKKEKKKKKRGKRDKDTSNIQYSPEDHDTAQQILIDLCNEMKDLKTQMSTAQSATTTNLDSNSKVLKSLNTQMEMIQSNMKQLDIVIESKATPDQIEELARIRAVQEMMKVVTDDKERTVAVYEQHARRGYEEIERLRNDLNNERKEVAALRAELDIVRGDRQRMMSSSGGGGLTPANMYIHAGDSVGGDSGAGGSHTGNSMKGPGAMYINGSGVGRKSFGGGDFDDMTLETKGSYETVQYEMKSLKKRIIHMKKKLTVAQMEAKETGTLRSEVERLRVQCETEKKASLAKDETIKRLENEIEELKRNQANAAAALSSFNKQSSGSSSKSGSSSGKASSRRSSQPQAPVSKTVTTTKKTKWWQNL